MRRFLLSVLMPLLCVASVFAAYGDDWPLREGFEGLDGNNLPAGWTQESVSGNAMWTVEAATAGYPSSNYSGSRRIALRNTTGQTQNYETWLISPVIDISLSKIANPILVFAHSQPHYTGDVDPLRVFYRTSAESRWVQIGSYESRVNGWKTDTLELFNPSTTYQIAFVGYDNMGRGIALDSIVIRPKPTCEVPYGFTYQNVTVSSATIQWLGSLDSDNFRVIVSKELNSNPLDIPNSGRVIDLNTDNFALTTGDVLEQNEHYYVYVRATCGEETPAWAVDSFYTANTISIPYFNNFNKDYRADAQYEVEYWTHLSNFTDADGIARPTSFIPAYMAGTNLMAQYSRDTTTCLAFAYRNGNINNLKPIPAGGYYAAAVMPQLEDGFNMNELQLTFSATSYNEQGSMVDWTGFTYRTSRLIVGVMTDPTDFSSFVPVDTAVLTTAYQFKDFLISLEKYNGTGRYIAFVSNFPTQLNMFCMDNLRITKREGAVTATDIRAYNLHEHSFDLTASMKGVDSWDLYVSKEDVLDGTVPTTWVYKQTGLTGDTYHVTLPDSVTGFINLYIQTTKGTEKSAVNYPVRYRLPKKLASTDYPLVIDFENTEYINYNQQFVDGYGTTDMVPFDFYSFYSLEEYSRHFVPGNVVMPVPSVDNSNGVRLYQNSTYAASGNNYITMRGTERYMVLPELSDEVSFKDLVVSFYLSSDEGDWYPGYYMAKVEVGVMTDPYDTASFAALASFDAEPSEYIHCVVPMDKYTGKGRFIALRNRKAINEFYDGCSSRLDDIRIDSVSCLPTSNVKLEASAHTIEMTWDANGSTSWNIKMATDANGMNIVLDTIVNTNKFTADSLEHNTTFYVLIEPVCIAGNTLQPDVYSVTTECDKFKLPYFEGFETMPSNVATTENPACWPNMSHLAYSAYNIVPYYSANAALSGSVGLYLGIYNLRSNFVTDATAKDQFGVLPEFEKPLNQLEFVFDATSWYTDYTDTLYVGTVDSTADMSTFEVVEAVSVPYPPTTHYVDMAKANPNHKYIAFLKKWKGDFQNPYYYAMAVDNIIVRERPACEHTLDFELSSATSSGVTITTSYKEAKQMEIRVAATSIDPNDTTAVYLIDQVVDATKPYVLSSDKLEGQTTYYVYVRSNCGGDAYGYWSDGKSFTTLCAAMELPYTETFESLQTGTSYINVVPDCWTETRTIYNNRYYAPYIYNGAAYQHTTGGTRSLYFGLYNASSTPNDVLYAAMPEFKTDVKAMQFTLWARLVNVNYPDTLFVGTFADPTDPSTFTVYESYNLTKTVYEKISVDFSSYTGTDKFIGFMKRQAGKNVNSRFYIDDITVDSLPLCDEITTYKFANVTDSSVNVDCNVKRAQKWEVVVYDKSVAIADMADNTPAYRGEFTARPFHVSGLTDNTTYYVRIRSNCGGDAWGDWAESESTFKTACRPKTPTELGTITINNTLASLDCWTTGAREGVPGTFYNANGLLLSCPTTADGIYAIMPPLDVDSINKYQVSFKMWYPSKAATNVGKVIVGVVTDPGDISTFYPVTTLTMPVASNKNNAPTFVVNFEDYFGDVDGNFGTNIMFLGETGSQALYCYLNDFVIEPKASCLVPNGLTVQEFSSKSATIKWDGNATDKYEVQLRQTSATGTIVAQTEVTGLSYTFAGLSASTTYYAFVRRVCGENDYSAWSVYVNFTTGCGEMSMPFYENFDVGHRDEYGPVCWTSYYNTTNTSNSESYPCVYEASANNHTTGGKAGLRFRSTSAVNSSVTCIPMESIGDFTLEFWYKGNAATNRRLIIGVCSDVSSRAALNASFDTLYDFTFATTAWTEFSQDFSYEGSGKYLAFMQPFTVSGYIYLDDLVIKALSSCKGVRNFSVAERELNSVKLAWDQGKAETKWDVMYVATGSTDTTTLTLDTASTNVSFGGGHVTATISGLQNSTQYSFWVRSKCSDSETSPWSEAATAWTRCQIAVPTTYDFDDIENQVITTGTYRKYLCWTLLNENPSMATNQTYLPQIYSNTAAYRYSYSDTAALRLYGYNGAPHALAVLPQLINPTKEPMQISLKARAIYQQATTGAVYANNQETYARAFSIGYLTDPEDPATYKVLGSFQLDKVGVSNVSDDPNGNKGWESIVFPLTSLPEQDVYYLALRSEINDVNYSIVFIDDLAITKYDATATTAMPKPAGLEVKNVIGSTATVAWKEQGTATQWEVAYFLSGTAFSTAKTETVSGKPEVTLTGLEREKDYVVYVRSVNGSEKSLWHGYATFTTPCLRKAPVTYDFEQGVPDCWMLQGFSVNSGNLDAYSGERYLYSGSSNAYALTPEFEDYDSLAITFKLRCGRQNEEGCMWPTYTWAFPHAVKIGYVTNPADMSTFVLLKECVSRNLSSSSEDSIQNDPLHDRWFDTFTVPLAGAKGQIVFLSNYGKSNYLWIDDVKVDYIGDTCFAPVKIEVSDVTNSSANFAWGSPSKEFEVRMSRVKDIVTIEKEYETILTKQITEKTFAATGLLPNTPHKIEVRGKCADGTWTDWTSAEFVTDCNVYTFDNTSWSFEDNLDRNNNYRLLPNCWTVGAQGGSGVSIVSGYNARKGNGLLFSQYTSTSNRRPYAILPKMDIDNDSARLVFWGRAAYFTEMGELNGTNRFYPRKLVIGYVKDRDADFFSEDNFVVMDTAEYPYTWTTAQVSQVNVNDDPDKYWVKFSFALDKYPQGYDIAIADTFLVFRNLNGEYPDENPNGGNSYFYVDDMAIVKIAACSEAENVSVSDITDKSAKFSWTIVSGVNNAVVDVATDEQFANIVASAEATGASTAEVTGLNPGTKYYYRVGHACNVAEVSEYVTGNFVTLYNIRYAEDFSQEAEAPDGWLRYQGKAEDVFQAASNLQVVSGSNVWHNLMSGSAGPVASFGTNMYSYMYSRYREAYYWAVSPGINLVPYGVNDSILLSFNLGLTAGTSRYPQLDSANTANLNDQFMVIVSDNNGASWSADNATVWSNDGKGDYVLNEVPLRGKRYLVDLSKYAGKAIRVAFYAASPDGSSRNALYLDNVQINTYQQQNFAATLCEYEDYYENGFTVDYDEMEVGENELVRSVLAREDGTKDRVYVANVTVTPALKTQLSRHICEGEGYNEDGFVIPNSKAGRYLIKTQSAGGCDSIVTLNLTVDPLLSTELFDTICQGQSLTWKGVEYRTSAVLYDTVPSLVTSCDSFLVMYLTVNPLRESENVAYLCYNTTLTIGNRTISQAGTYYDTIPMLEGCDSIAVWEVIAEPEYKTMLRRTTCESVYTSPETYKGNPIFDGLSRNGVYSTTLESVTGCDSVLTLKLWFVTDGAIITDTVEAEDLPYIINGKEEFPAGLANGDYTKTIAVSCGQITLNMRVGDNTGIVENRAGNLTTLPNPVSTYTDFRVRGSFESDNVSVVVFNGVGAVVYSAKADVQHGEIIVPGLPQAGMYMLQVTGQNNDIYRTKVMVK